MRRWSRGKKYANSRAAGLINGVLRSAIRRRGRSGGAPGFGHLVQPPPAPGGAAGRGNGAGGPGAGAGGGQSSAGDGAPGQPSGRGSRGSFPPPSKAPGAAVCRTLGWSALPDRRSGQSGAAGGVPAGPVLCPGRASRLAVRCAGVQPGMRVLDSCAAPGGKSFAAAMDMGGQGRLISCDIHRHKLTLIQQGGGPAGPFLHCNPAAGCPGAGSGVGRRHGPGAGGRAVRRPGHHPKEAGHPVQGPGRDGGASPACSWRF